MNGQSRPYAIHSDGECDRLERQAMLAGLEEHLARLSGLPRLTSILDVGCGSGSMARLLAAKHPDAQVVDRSDTSSIHLRFSFAGLVPAMTKLLWN